MSLDVFRAFAPSALCSVLNFQALQAGVVINPHVVHKLIHSFKGLLARRALVRLAWFTFHQVASHVVAQFFNRIELFLTSFTGESDLTRVLVLI